MNFYSYIPSTIRISIALCVGMIFSGQAFSQCNIADHTVAATGSANISQLPSSTAACMGNLQYYVWNVCQGDTYNWSTCGGASWDTELTVFNHANGQYIGYDNDGCAPQSSFTWTATFDGSVRVALDRFECDNNADLCAQIIGSRTASAPLTITCPNNIVKNTNTGTCTAVVNYNLPTSTGACESVSLYTGQGIGATFPIGVSTETYLVTDIRGNTQQCSFTITVEDQLPPTMDCQNATVSLGADGTVEIDPAIFDENTVDNCGGPVTFSLPSGTVFECDKIGTVSLHPVASDNLGNTATCLAILTVVEEFPPTLSCPNEIIQPLADPSDTEAFVSVPAPAVSDNCGGNIALTNDVTGSPSNADGIYQQGITPVVWTATDEAGNTANCTINVKVVGNSAPIISCPLNITKNTDIGSCNAAVTVPLPQASDDNALASVLNDFNGTSNASDSYPEGATTVTWTATDVDGNSSDCTMSITVNDTQKPSISCPNDINVPSDAGSCDAALSISLPIANDNCGITTVKNNFNNSLNASGTYPLGVTNVTWTATDVNGNTQKCTTVVTVGADEAPIAVCKNHTVYLSGGAASITPPDVDGGSTAGCGISSLNAVPKNYNCSNLGIVNVTLIVTDTEGNTADCSAKVYVLDNTPPTANCKNATVTLDESGNGYITPVNVNNSSSDDCAIQSTFVSPKTFTCSDLGTNTATLTVTDTGNNESSCTSIITVVEQTPLSIQCKDVTVYLTSSGGTSLTPPQLVESFSSTCGIQSVTAGNLTFSTTGTNPITVTATDVNGQTASCTSVVTVEENGAPSPSPISASQCGYGATSGGTFSQTSGVICPGDNAPAFNVSGIVSGLTTEYVITRNDDQFPSGASILGARPNTGAFNPANFGVQDGDEFCITALSYNLGSIQAVAQELLHGDALGVGSCCSAVQSLLGANLCSALNAAGLYNGSDIQQLDDIIGLLSAFGAEETLESIASAINSVNGIGNQDACINDLPICYALSSNSLCYVYSSIYCAVEGCTNPGACNFNPTATIDDGSCDLPSGCTNLLACNYDPSASCDDGSCVLPDGCTNPDACNYDPLASCDDGSCVLPDGCTNPAASNYDPLARCDDGSCVFKLRLKAKVLLEGPYSGGGLMDTDLHDNGFLPFQQPFNRLPWNYGGNELALPMPASITDWVLLELRDGGDAGNIVSTRASLIGNDGTMRDTDGSEGVVFDGVNENDSYYIVVKTRNHLAVLSSGTVVLPNATTYDFTTSAAQVQGAGQMAEPETGVFALWAGDINSDGLVTVSDYNLFKTEMSSMNGYFDSDFQMNVSVTVHDYDLYLTNSSKTGVTEIRY